MKRGRPKQTVHKSIFRICRLSPDEDKLFIQKVKESGMNKSEFIRHRILADADEVTITFGN